MSDEDVPATSDEDADTAAAVMSSLNPPLQAAAQTNLDEANFKFVECKDIDIISFDELKTILVDFESKEMRSKKASVVVTEDMKYIYSCLCEDELPFTLVLQGGSGIGKTTTLTVIGYLARSSGCLVLPIQAHMFMNLPGTVSNLLRAFLVTWRKANLELLSNVQSSRMISTLLSLVDDCLKDCSVSKFVAIVHELLVLTEVPVVLIVDQYNLFSLDLNDDDVDLSNRKQIARQFSCVNELSVARGCILFASTASFDSTPLLRDGNTALIFELEPLDKSTFSKMIGLLVQTGYLPAYLSSNQKNLDEFYAHCGGLPREAQSFCSIRRKNLTMQELIEQNTASRSKFYEDRLQRLLSSAKAADMQQESCQFAMGLLFSDTMLCVPRSWQNSGLVVHEGSHYRLACRAAEQALVKHFTPVRMRQSIAILGSDDSISWRVLELCFIYRFRRSLLGNNTVQLQYTDLSGSKPGVLQAKVSRFKVVSRSADDDSLMPGTFVVYPRGQKLVDFFIYTDDEQMIFVQISESSYADHRSKLTDMHQLVDLAKIVKGDSSKATKHYLVVTTSSQLMHKSVETRSQYFNENVKLISNFQGDTDKLFEGLIPPSRSVPAWSMDSPDGTYLMKM